MDFSKPEYPKRTIENVTQNQDKTGFERILYDPTGNVKSQPIFSFFTGEVYGYRVNCELQSTSSGVTTTELLGHTETLGKVAHLERAIWEHILTEWTQSGASSVLFLPVKMFVAEDAKLTVSLMDDLIRRFGLSPRRIVLEIMDTVPCRNCELAKGKIELFRHYGYSFALGNLDNHHPFLQSILLFRPDYVKVDLNLVVNVHQDNIQTGIIEVVLDLARKLHFQVIAKGISEDKDLQLLLGLGIHFGQGPLLEQPIPTTVEGSFEGTHLIQEWLKNHERMSSHRGKSLDNIIKPVKTAGGDTSVAQVVQYFNEFKLELGIVVVQDEKPIGLVMRDKLFQRLAFKYGYALYWNREITNLMDSNPLIVEMDTTLETASRLSMGRHQDQIYDLIIATRRGKLVGVVTIRDMLNAITEAQMEFARDANPLTWLPGNRRIERELAKRIEAEESFSIIYTDLDYFKWFNDQYGFRKGDLVIQFTASLLRSCLGMYGESDDFVGHVGGDDFILITKTKDIKGLCHAITSRFDREIIQFYPDSEKYMELRVVTDRSGQPVRSTGIAISLAVLECHNINHSEVSLERIAEEAGHLKKRAKSVLGSTSVHGNLLPN